MQRKMYAITAVLLVVMSALAGCGSGNNPKEESGSNAGEGKAKSVTLKMIGLTPPWADSVNQMVDEYEAANPGVKIEFQIPPEDPYTLLKTRFASGDAPDIFHLSGTDIPAWADKLADLSDEPWMEHVLLEGVPLMTIDGKQAGFPLQMEGNGILYNKDLFEQAGITEIPTTLTELKQVVEQLDAAGIQSFGEAWANWGFLMHLLGVPFAYEADQAGFVHQLNQGNKGFQDLANMDNFFTVLDLTVDHGFGGDSIAYDYNEQIKDFANGKMAMVKQGTWYTSVLLQQNPNLNMGMFAVPLNDDASQSKLLVSTSGYFVVNKESANLEESKKFLNWLHDHMGKYFVEQMKLMPVFDDVESGHLGPLYEDMNGYLEAGKTYDNYGVELWPAGFQTDIAKPLQAYIAGVSTKEEAIEELQKLWMQQLRN
ncbi:ABC transporter substrate-binding protein [Paenibacillaceae bacterium WGS1546]|uniref:ABC transporter substrate-binding protein n=1 Tax=Cohnella sp. WGS1546 TaxID=3366810 RepID=UPI00372D0523